MEGKYPKHRLKGRQYGRVFALLMELQHGCCAICGKNVSRLPKGPYGRENLHYVLYIDHCHMTGMIRGLLCGNCNGMLGLLEDSRRLETTDLFAWSEFERWHATYLTAIIRYMRVDQWFPRKDTTVHIRQRLEEIERT